jgi:protein required for attachment to host cells
MMKQNRTWIVVADGGQARILLCENRSSGVRQLPNSEFHDSHLPTHELMTDRQPRVHDSLGSARHAVEPRTDPHKQRKVQFLAQLTEHLQQAAERKEFEHLVIVAPPSALGEIRKDFGPLLQQLLFAEFTHDYAHQTNDYVYRHINDGLPS